MSGQSADLLQKQADALVEQWTAAERRQFGSLMEEAASALQREMLLRTVAAGHRPAELTEFAQRIRPLADEALYSACTLGARSTAPMKDRLLAQADPLLAYELNCGAASAYPVVGGSRQLLQPPPQRPAFEQESSVARGKPLIELGASGQEVPSYSRPRSAKVAPPGSSVLNEAVAPFGFAYREEAVDLEALSLERALELAVRALGRGLPVPVTLGKKAGERGRPALILQLSVTPKSRAFQLHDPFAGETVWVNERDLLARTELPFAAKQWRRITRIALPVGGRKLGR